MSLGILTPVALLVLLGLAGLSLGVPLLSLAHWLLEGSSTVFQLDSLVSAVVSSLQLGVAGAALTVLLALPIAWLSVRVRGKLSMFVERSTYVGHSLPGIVVALALTTVAIRFVRPVYQTEPLLLVAYAILFLPLAVVSIRATLLQVPPVLEETARSLGINPLAVVWRVTLRLIAPGMGAGMALVFLAIVTELTATLLLAPTGTQTLATRFWSNADSIAYGAAAPYALLMVMLSAPATYLLTRRSSWASGG